jgi:hypothetical protein
MCGAIASGWLTVGALDSLALPKAHRSICRVAWQGMGDEVMVLIAKSLSRVPTICSLNLEGNRLTDKSLKLVIRSVHP